MGETLVRYSLIKSFEEKKEVDPGATSCIKDFDAMRQYFHDLRLESELSDLRSGNANLFVRKKN